MTKLSLNGRLSSSRYDDEFLLRVRDLLRSVKQRAAIEVEMRAEIQFGGELWGWQTGKVLVGVGLAQWELQVMVLFGLGEEW